MEYIAIATGVVDVMLLGVGGAVLRYMVSIESRLTRIETKLDI